MAGPIISPKEHPDLLPWRSARTWPYVLAVAGLLALLAIVLLAMGRVPWCTCGYVKLWHGVVMSSENSQHITDWYTFSHIVHGFGLYGILWLVGRSWALGLRLTLATAVEVSWEIIENTEFVINRYRDATIALDYYGDSVINSAADVLACILGFLLAARLPVWATVALAVAMEAVVGYVIRDSLTLNIIMLIHRSRRSKRGRAGLDRSRGLAGVDMKLAAAIARRSRRICRPSFATSSARWRLALAMPAGVSGPARRQITSAGLGQRLANSWRDRHYPNQKLDAASLVYTKAPQIIRAFDEGAVVRSKRGHFLAIPTENAPRKGTDGRRISPSTFPEHRFGPLRFVPRQSGPSLLVVDGLRASFSRKTGELRGFRRATDRVRRSGQGLTTVVMFLLVPQVKLSKRLDVARAAERWSAQLPALIEQQLRAE